MELQTLRARIDEIDGQMIDLFRARMETAREIAALKRENGMPVLNPGREREVLSLVAARAGTELESYAGRLYQTMFAVSRSYQNSLLVDDSGFAARIGAAVERTPALFPHRAVVACQGVEGAYSQQACDKLFQLPSIQYFQRFDGVFEAVESGLCRYGILPINNSSNGSVGRVYDLMRDHRFHIVRSIRLCVRHSLLAKPGVRMDEVKEIVSHEQAIGQCGAFLQELRGVKVTACESTAVAARMVAESGRRDIAAISSARCAELYGLCTLSDSVQNSENNYTRFICIGKELEIFPGANRISLMLSTAHRPGSLYELLSKFAAIGVNLTNLESRPLPGSDFEFVFYFDMEASVLSPGVAKLLAELASSPELFVFLGNYAEVN